MQFNTVAFFLFFPIVTLLYYLIPQKYRRLLLLAAGVCFYMWFIPKYIYILLILTAIGYSVGLLLERWRTDRLQRKICLIVGVVLSCAVLFVFKYLNFCSEIWLTTADLLGLKHPQEALNILLPVGISFNVLQNISYMVEVYRQNQNAERQPDYYALYLMFYPIVLSGPIERPQNLLPQLHRPVSLRYDNIANGLRLILFGLLLKVTVADNLGFYVDRVFNHPQLYSTSDILIGILFFSFQIYADFWGFTSIAIGCAATMGFKLTDNFRVPYSAASFSEFWTRWNITLSSWFRDYLYAPMMGKRTDFKRRWWVLLIVFALIGLWHGAHWTFLIWGLAFAVCVIAENVLRMRWSSKHTILPSERPGLRAGCVVFVFVTVTLLWSIFRASSLSNLGQVYHALFLHGGFPNKLHVNVVTWVALGIFILLDILLRHTRFDVWCGRQCTPIRWSLYAVMIFSVVVFSRTCQTPFLFFCF